MSGGHCRALFLLLSTEEEEEKKRPGSSFSVSMLIEEFGLASSAYTLSRFKRKKVLGEEGKETILINPYSLPGLTRGQAAAASGANMRDESFIHSPQTAS